MTRLLFLLAIACSPDPTEIPSPTEATPTPQTPVDTADSGCGSSIPTLSNGVIDVQTSPDVRIILLADANDPDGDLHEFEATVAIDTVLDGEVGADAVQVMAAGAVPGATQCEEQGVTVGVRVPSGAPVPWDTLVEVTVHVEDANGNRSAPLVFTGTTPRADGTFAP